jgi:hypothetical protein
VIQSFADETTVDLFRERNTRAARRIPREPGRGTQRKLGLLDAAGRLETLDWPAMPPGEILLEEYLKPVGLGQVQAAKRLGVSLNRLSEIILGKRGITPARRCG